MNVNLHIDQIVLEGIDVGPVQAEHLRHLVAQQLTSLLQSSVPGDWSDRTEYSPRLSAPPLNLAPNASVGRLGTDLAGAVYASLGCGGTSVEGSGMAR